MSLYGLTEHQLSNRRAVCEAWGHASRVINVIGIGTINQCPRCGTELFVSPCIADDPTVRAQWERDHAEAICNWHGGTT